MQSGKLHIYIVLLKCEGQVEDGKLEDNGCKHSRERRVTGEASNAHTHMLTYTHTQEHDLEKPTHIHTNRNTHKSVTWGSPHTYTNTQKSVTQRSQETHTHKSLTWRS